MCTGTNYSLYTHVQKDLRTSECRRKTYPLNGRNNYQWTWRDENNDNDGPGCYPESLNTGFDLAYDEDKGFGFGNAATTGTLWDDWFISPNI